MSEPQSLAEVVARAMAAVDGSPWEPLMPQAAAAVAAIQKLFDAGAFAGKPLPELAIYTE